MNLKVAKDKENTSHPIRHKTVKFIGEKKPQPISKLVANKGVFNSLIKKASRPSR